MNPRENSTQHFELMVFGAICRKPQRRIRYCGTGRVLVASPLCADLLEREIAADAGGIIDRFISQNAANA
jgi:hypothetical protein